MITAILAALAVGAAGAPESAPPPACRPAVQAAWPQLQPALKDASLAGPAIERITALEPLCKDDPGIGGLLRSLHADLLHQTGRSAEAIALLEAAPLAPDHGLWPTSQWTLLSASEVVGDAARFTRTRDALLAAHDRALTSGPDAMRKIERFETPLAVVDAYEGKILNGPFVRMQVFVAAPKDGGMPATLAVGTDPATALIMGDSGKTTVFFLDYYPCEMHATMKTLSRKTKDGPPPYAEMKKEAERLFSAEGTFKPFAKLPQYRYCAFERFMLPGFSKGAED